MATPALRALVLRQRVNRSQDQVDRDLEDHKISESEFYWIMQSLDEERSDIYRAEKDTRPRCFDAYEGETFCKWACCYCDSWKTIHGEKAAEQAEKQGRWLYFWRCEESKETLEQIAAEKRHGCIFKSHIEEELIARAWHPDRFVTWCLDNEELAIWMAA